MICESAVGAVVVSYNGGDVLEDCINAIAPQVSQVVVVDNGSREITLSVLEQIESLPHIKVVKLQSNAGIGAALNIGVALLARSDIDWVVTLDQDSIVSTTFISAFSAYQEQYPESVMMVPRVDMLHTRAMKSGPVLTAITSGNLVKIELIRAVGGYDEGLFIDSVDFDFCLRVAKKKEKIMLVAEAAIQHSLGESSRVPTRFYTNHPPIRRYYIYRNLMHMIARYFFSFPKFIIRFIVIHFLDFLSICIFGPCRRKSVQAIVLGIFDGLCLRQGKCFRNM